LRLSFSNSLRKKTAVETESSTNTASWDFSNREMCAVLTYKYMEKERKIIAVAGLVLGILSLVRGSIPGVNISQ
jgi:hypothetical protein